MYCLCLALRGPINHCQSDRRLHCLQAIYSFSYSYRLIVASDKVWVCPVDADWISLKLKHIWNINWKSLSEMASKRGRTCSLNEVTMSWRFRCLQTALREWLDDWVMDGRLTINVNCRAIKNLRACHKVRYCLPNLTAKLCFKGELTKANWSKRSLFFERWGSASFQWFCAFPNWKCWAFQTSILV